ncbi:MAG: hypothetical protein RLZZ453_425 [Chlamydiota bacterium]|jgi:hypothetical protein
MNSFESTAPILYAGAAIVPSYCLFDRAAQARMSENPTRCLAFGPALYKGIYAAPGVAVIAGSQMIIQQQAENYFKRFNSHTLTNQALSSMTAGALTAHLEYGFTQFTMGNYSPWKSMMQLSRKQAGLYAMRNGLAVFGISSSSNAANRMKQYDMLPSKVVDYITAACTGGIGGILGHPFNAKIIEEAIRQSGKTPPKISITRGMGWRSASVAAFATSYKIMQDISRT